MNPLTRTLRAYAADARSALRDAPVEIVLGLLMALLTLVATRTPRFTEEAWARVAASVALAFPLVFAASVLAARGVVSARTRWAATAAVLAACAAVGGLAIHAERAASWWRWAMLFGAALCALALTPVLPLAARDRRRTWTFVYRTVLRAAGLVAYAGALWLILAGAVAAVVSLFELREPRHLYGDLAAILFFAFVPWVFVGGLPRLVADDGGGPPPALVTLLGRWLFAPVLVIYLAILYAYAVKVAATGELPRNLVSPLVLGAGLVGLIGAVLL
ncbi:MAG TPA: hypothetical protein VNP72_10965, partial [Longimicrobium sp.]|nr:hypothetical protein [Longimicrobium sp.]